ncbi:MAG: fused DSP-PTPase phosphatase/NAD kinase-like protein [Syntrophales bacterium]
MIKKIIPFLLMILLTGSPALADVSNRPSQWALPVQVPGVPNLYKINDNLYRSGEPTKQGMKTLKTLGIRTVINLRAFYYGANKIRGTGLLNEELSVKPWHIEDEDVIRVLKKIREKENGPFLIYCEYGADRSGVMTAMYRILEQGWTKDEAIEEMVYGGYGFHPMWSNIIRYVKNVDVEKIKRALVKQVDH